MGENGVSYRFAAYVGVLQLVQALSWVVYVIFLPQLAAKIGLPPSAVLLILLLDQAVFVVCDYAVGVAADRTAKVVGRLGTIAAGVTVVSGLAFMALPFIAEAGSAAMPLFIAVTVIWTATSAALRAPPLMLLGKYAAKPELPWLAALVMLGIGLAGAVAPYLGIFLRGIDPRLPFALASLAVVLPALALAKAERTLAKRSTAKAETAARGPPRAGLTVVFAAAVVVLALGFQIHFAVNTAPLFSRFVSPDGIGLMMPIFFAGFSLAMFPAGLLVKRYGGIAVMGAGGVAGAVALMTAAFAGSLGLLVVAQFLAGAAWGAVMMSAMAAAIAIGSTGAEGRMLGLMFSGLALAAFTRIAATATGLTADPAAADLLGWLPALCWLLAGGALVWLAASRWRAATRM